MKSLIALACFLAVLIVRQQVLADDSALEKAISFVGRFLKEERAHLRTVLHQLRHEIDLKLDERFPHLREKIHALGDKIFMCYDPTIGGNSTLNILHANIRHVIEQFFHSHGHLLLKLNQAEIHKRVQNFISNLAHLGQLLVECVENGLKGRPTMKLGLTPLSIYSRDEIENKILNKHLMNRSAVKLYSKGRVHLKAHKLDAEEEIDNLVSCNLDKLLDDKPIPQSFSWKDKGYVSPVYDQLKCGSCYVFSVTSALESQYMISHQTTQAPHYSVQATLNCMPKGCDGGDIFEAAKFLEENGATDDRNMPYLNTAQNCRGFAVQVQPKTHIECVNPSEIQMQRLLMKYGPAAVVIDASSESFAKLKRSPYTGDCTENFNHAVLLVGWTADYWIIKNSWSEFWGIDGYLELPRGSNKCGIRSLYTVPILNLNMNSN